MRNSLLFVQVLEEPWYHCWNFRNFRNI